MEYFKYLSIEVLIAKKEVYQNIIDDYDGDCDDDYQRYRFAVECIKDIEKILSERY